MNIWTLLPFSPLGSLPTILVVVPDLIIRLVALGWLPYRRKPSTALAWLMAIFLIPYIGLVAFFIFGSARLPKKRRERQRTITELTRKQTGDQAIIGDYSHLPPHLSTAAQLNYSLGALPMTHGNRFELLGDNNEAIARMAADVRKATEVVHFVFYIVAQDEVSKPLVDALVDAHQRGVAVKILIDHMGSAGYPGYAELVKRLDAENVAWRRALPVRPWRGEYQRPDLRNHRKILTVDGKLAYTGSQNIIDRTYNKKRNLRKGYVWKDLMVRATGPVVAELDSVFGSDWFSETGDILSDEMALQIVDEPEHDGAMSQVVPSGPDFPLENNLRLFNHLISNASKTIVISSPYFVPDESMLSALITEAHSGVDVRIYVGESSDHGVVQRAQESYYEELVEAGVHILLYPAPTVLHAKFLIVDDESCVIGSSNMDQRSFALDHEVSTFIVDEEFTSRMYALEEAEFASCSTEVDVERWRERSLAKKAVENVCRLTSSLL